MSPWRISPVDLGIVVTYFALVIGLGIWLGRRRIRSSEALFLADREATWPLIGASLFSANISSQQFVGQAGLAYSIGLAAGAFQMVGSLCFVLLAVFFVDVYLGMRLRTAPEFFERRYGPGPRLFVSGLNLLMILAANLVTALYAGATVLTGLVGSDGGGFQLAVIALAVAAGLYAVLGGLRSVLWIDLLQAALLIVGGAITLFVALRAAGGPAAALAQASGVESATWSLLRPWDHAFGWLPLLTGGMILGVHSHCTDHDYVQRALAARSVYHSKMGALFAGFLKVLALFIIAAPGVLAAQLLPGLAHPDQAYTRLVTQFVPVGLTGLVLAGLLAAILGTVAAGLSAGSALLTFDFALRLRPGLSEAARVRFGRATMVVLLAASAAAAPGIRSFPGVFTYLVQTWSLLAPAVFVCVVAGVFTRRASHRGATATLVVGTVLGALSFWALGAHGPALPRYLQSPLNVGFAIAVICALTMAAASQRTPVDSASSSGPGAPAGPMTRREQRIFRGTLLALMMLWVVVLWTFSPWGIAGGR